jgi:hypothetical protein
MTVETEAAAILANARRTAAAREAIARPIDYDRMNRVRPHQKAALTRAIRSGSKARLLVACRDAVREWDKIGCWPDDWNVWQIALDDALGLGAPALGRLRRSWTARGSRPGSQWARRGLAFHEVPAAR